MNCKKFQLKNGLTVLFNKSQKSPVVSVQMWVRTGSADEGRGLEGISHFIEHLVFKGTQKYGVGQIASLIEGSGGELNAYTSFDQTVFYVTISKLFAETGLDVISQMMGFPTFVPEEVDNEREVVIEEIKRGLDSPSRKASQLLFSKMFKGHPYSIPVIGYEKNIKKVSRKKILDYFHTRYVPKNMFLVITGDFEEKTMRQLVNEYFGKFKPFKLKPVRRKKLVPLSGKPITIESSSFEDDQVHFSFRVPNGKHKDIPALDLAALILGQGDSSRLVNKMRIENALVQGVGASTFTPQDAGIFSISLNLKTAQAPMALIALNETLLQFFKNPASQEELLKAHINFESELIYGVETVDALARRMGHLEFFYKDPNYSEKYIKQVKGVNYVALKKALKKYLNPKNLKITGMSKDPAGLSLLLNDFYKAYKQTYAEGFSSKSSRNLKPIKIPNLKVKRASSAKENIEKLVLKNGITLLTRFDSELPILSAKACYLGGIRAEQEDRTGVVELLSRSWISKSNGLSEPEIYSLFESRASSLSAFSGRNTIGMSYDGLTSFESDLLPIWTDILTQNHLEESIFQREKQLLLNQIKSRNDSPSQLAMLKLHAEIFKDHPYAKDLFGTLETTGKTQLNDLKKYFDDVVTPANLTVCISGSFDRQRWIETLNKIPKKETGFNTHKMFSQKEIKTEARFGQNLDRQQAHIALAYKGLTLNSKEKYALEIIQSILSGQGGRLFVELRDKNSLAYSVSPIKFEGIDAGYFGGYIACAPEKTETAIKMLKAEFIRLAHQPISEEELERAKRYIIGRHDIDLQRNSTISSAILFEHVYGLDYNQIFDCAPQYEAVTRHEVQNLAKSLFLKEPIISIVGPGLGH